ncbi:hypothetical protein Ciccas_010086 [Cichlidogyrus casuarinus]|uniref:Uncharacterized protein n=1 Tax=Cichlidogyrus casuarinus TaxID=1844966 RepID=A0ABD2PZP7_9PLAT
MKVAKELQDKQDFLRKYMEKAGFTDMEFSYPESKKDQDRIFVSVPKFNNFQCVLIYTIEDKQGELYKLNQREGVEDLFKRKEVDKKGNDKNAATKEKD